MAKTIKFNLICDSNPIRTIEELQNNFSIEDILNYYKNGLLVKWLNVRGFEKYEKEVSALSKMDDVALIENLIRIFGIEKDPNIIKEAVYSFQYEKQKEVLLKSFEEKKSKYYEKIDDYFSGYNDRVFRIKNNESDISIIKTEISQIAFNYFRAFEFNYRDFFWQFSESPLVLMCLLMNEITRCYYLPQTIIQKDGSSVLDTSIKKDKSEIFDFLYKNFSTSDFLEKLGNNLHRVRKCGGMWEDIADKTQKCMVLDIPKNTQIRDYEIFGSEKNYSNIFGTFPILNGLQYKSECDSGELLYMEV